MDYSNTNFTLMMVAPVRRPPSTLGRIHEVCSLARRPPRPEWASGHRAPIRHSGREPT